MIPFIKMQGIGNDYIYVNAFAQRVSHPAELARRVSDRHFGVGSDGLILVMPPSPGIAADVRMRMFNADGSESEMCGNGIRCVCKFAHDEGISRAIPMRIETGAGVLELHYTLDEHGKVDQVTVDMGEPILDLTSVPVRQSALTHWDRDAHLGRIEAGGDANDAWNAVFVSMGNPHAVLFADANPHIERAGLAALKLWQIGPAIEHHPAFPRRINAHFVSVQSRREATMRTWERGSGITLACGTGACAVAVAGILTGRFDREMLLHLPGGDLRMRWDERTNHVFKTGPAREVFRGEWPEDGDECAAKQVASGHARRPACAGGHPAPSKGSR